MKPARKKTAAPTTQQKWRPDWRDEDQYPKLKETKNIQWAWEFLRRNPEYQKLWQKHIAPYYHPEKGFESDEASDAGMAKMHIFEKKFGIAILAPPPSRNKSGIKFLHHFVATQRKLSRGSGPLALSGEVKDGEVIVHFNLAFPLKPQLERAKKVLEGDLAHLKKKGVLKEIKHRSKKEHYARYLRILDAVESGATRTEIAKIIYPRVKNAYPEHQANKKISDDLRAAKTLCNKDYLYISR